MLNFVYRVPSSAMHAGIFRSGRLFARRIQNSPVTQKQCDDLPNAMPPKINAKDPKGSTHGRRNQLVQLWTRSMCYVSARTRQQTIAFERIFSNFDFIVISELMTRAVKNGFPFFNSPDGTDDLSFSLLFRNEKPSDRSFSTLSGERRVIVI